MRCKTAFLFLLFRIHEFRHPTRSAGGVHAGQNAAALGQKNPRSLSLQAIRMLNTGAGDSAADGLKIQFFIVKGGSAVFYGQFDNNEIDPVFFQFAVGQPVDSQQFGAPHLKPYWVDRMMHHTRLVCLIIAGNDCDRLAGDLRADRKVL